MSLNSLLLLIKEIIAEYKKHSKCLQQSMGGSLWPACHSSQTLYRQLVYRLEKTSEVLQPPRVGLFSWTTQGIKLLLSLLCITKPKRPSQLQWVLTEKELKNYGAKSESPFSHCSTGHCPEVTAGFPVLRVPGHTSPSLFILSRGPDIHQCCFED